MKTADATSVSCYQFFKLDVADERECNAHAAQKLNVVKQNFIKF